MSGPLSLPLENVYRRPPVNIVADDETLFIHEYERQIAAIEATALQNVRILRNGYLMRAAHVLPHTFAVRPLGLRRVLIAARVLRHSILSSISSTIQTGLFITDEFSNGFFHWICDVLPRLEALRFLAPEELETRTVLVPWMASFQYIGETLKPYGRIGVRNLLAREQIRCNDLLVIPAVAPTGNYRPHLMHAIRTRFRSYFKSGAAARRIFISRTEAPKRRISNEEALLPVLERFGFERMVLEDLPFAEQVRLIGSAEVLAGSHGAGLANMCWMEPATKVLELRRRGDAENNCYYSLASALNLEYSYMQCDPVESKSDSHGGDLQVDPAELERSCAALFSERKTE
jgi:capsular polysaccharide biosynthesis protein